jgi:hypothetical protein
MRHRSARAWELFGRLLQRSSVERSSLLNSTGTNFGSAIAPPIVADDDRTRDHRATYAAISDSGH